MDDGCMMVAVEIDGRKLPLAMFYWRHEAWSYAQKEGAFYGAPMWFFFRNDTRPVSDFKDQDAYLAWALPMTVAA